MTNRLTLRSVLALAPTPALVPDPAPAGVTDHVPGSGPDAGVTPGRMLAPAWADEPPF